MEKPWYYKLFAPDRKVHGKARAISKEVIEAMKKKAQREKEREAMIMFLLAEIKKKTDPAFAKECERIEVSERLATEKPVW